MTKLGARETLDRIRAVLRLCMTAGPAHTAGYALTVVVTGLLPVTVAWSTKLLLDRLGGVPGTPAIPVLVAALAGCAIAAGVLSHLTSYLQGELGRRLDAASQDRLFAALNSFSGLSRFESPAFQNRIQLAEEGTGGNLATLVTGLFGMVRDAITAAGLLAALIVISPPMACAVLVTGVPILLAELSLSRRRAELLARSTGIARRRIAYSTLLTDVRAAKEVRLLALGDLLRGRLRRELRSIHGRQRDLDRRELVVQSVLITLGALVSGAGLAWVCLRVADGSLTVGDVSVFVAAVAGVQAALAGLINLTASVHEGIVLFGHYLHVLQKPDDLPAAPEPVRLRPLRRRIEFRGVWFRYTSEGPWVLSDVDLVLERGQSLAVVGLNGAGKSTLAKLLCRFYDPVRGAVLWDGVDIREFPVGELRARIGALFQDFMTYDLTAAENIGLGDATALDDADAITRAARLAGIADVIEGLPRGYDTQLSRTIMPDERSDDAGIDLSGGQWQRLALARLFMRADRDLLILDEASSGLDPAAEHDLHRTLTRGRGGRTSLLISHRLGAIRNAERILVLDHGRVIEHGAHAELMAADGRYAELFRLQAEQYATPLTLVE